MRYELVFRKKSPVVVALFFGFLLPAVAVAQTDGTPRDRFEQLKRRMDEQMRRIIPPADTLFGKGRNLQIAPDSSSFFYFHVDTTFDGTGSHFFDFRSFDLFGGDGPSRLDQMFEQFFQGANPFGRPRSRSESGPSDDGNTPPSDDDLLPEERLRQQERPAPNQAPKPKESSKTKTIRL